MLHATAMLLYSVLCLCLLSVFKGEQPGGFYRLTQLLSDQAGDARSRSPVSLSAVSAAVSTLQYVVRR